MQVTQTEVDRLAESAREHGRLGLDTEFMPEGRYKPLLCLVQIVVGEHVEVLDPLVRQLRPGAAGRGARRPGDRDRPARRPPGRRDPAPRVADDVHERLRHAGRRGLRRLLGPGRLQRPAARRAADPAAEDRELHALGRAPADRRAAPLRARRRRAPAAAGRRHPARGSSTRGRLEWAREECVAIAEATDERDPDEVWRRLPRVSGLDPRERAVARELAAWRERTAAREDRPVGAVLRDPTVVELAKRQPRGRRELAQIRGITPGRRAPARRRRHRGDRARPRAPSRSSSRRATARRPRPSTARRSRSPSRSCARARRRPGWPTS